jgi:putative ABC transport system permease protein
MRRLGERDRRRYRWLLGLYPEEMRERYGEEMEDTLLAHLDDACARGGKWRVWAVWLAASVDALRWGTAMRFRESTMGGDVMGGLAADVRYALRSLVKRPLFTTAAVLTLALGIGANGAVFSVSSTLLFRPLPYPDAHELVRIWAADPERGFYQVDINPADAWSWRERAGVFEDLAVVNEAAFTLTGGDRPERVEAVVGTPNVLSVLGVRVALGRDLQPDDNLPGAPRVVILTHEAWERRFGADPSLVGRTLVLDGTPATVVGITGPGFVFLDERPEMVAPLGEDPAAVDRSVHSYEVVARLRDGVSVADAGTAVRDVSRQLEAEFPDTNSGWTADVLSLRDDMLGDVAKPASLVLMAAVFFVLVMACVNVANLLLARAGARRVEIAVRSALGAGRARIARQLLVESLVLAGAGGALGFGGAWAGSRYIVAALPDDIPPIFRFELDGTVVAFLAMITLLSALAVGLAPALRLARLEAGDLREGGRTGGALRQGLGGPLVVIQTALAVVLLAGSGLMMRSVLGMVRTDPGFDPAGVLTFRLAPPEMRYPTMAELEDAHTRALDAIRALPGVEAAGSIQSLPLAGANWYTLFEVAGLEEAPGETFARNDQVSPGYFDAMGLEVVQGRAIDARDVVGAEPVAVVTESFTERFLAGREPVGATLSIGEAEPVTYRVVGVVEDHLTRGIDRPVEPVIFRAAAQFPAPLRGRSVAIRTGSAPLELLPSVQRAVQQVDPELPVYTAVTMEQVLATEIGGFRLIAELMGSFGALSLLLGAIGIYGVTAYAVGQRSHEIGIRLALGAGRRSVVGMMVAQGARRALLGVAVGTALAVPLGRSMTGVLVGVSPTDPVSLGVTAAVLLVVAVLACWLPARRAAAVAPARTLVGE